MILLTSARPPGTPQGPVTALQERATPSRGPQHPECSPGRSFRCRSPPVPFPLCPPQPPPGDLGTGRLWLSSRGRTSAFCSSHLHRTPELTRRELRGCPFKTPPIFRMVPLGLPALRHLFPSPRPAGPSARRRLQPGAGWSQRRGPDRAPPLCSRRNDDEPDFQVTKTRRQKEEARVCRQLRGLRPLPFHSLFAQKG